MFVIWKRNGIAVPVVTILSLLALDYVTSKANGPGYYASHVWPKLVAFLIAAAAVLLIVKTVDDDDEDSFFFVPMKYWVFILAIGGAILAFTITEPGHAGVNPPHDNAPAVATEQSEPASSAQQANLSPPPATISYSDPPSTRRPVAPVASEAPQEKPRVLEQVYIDRNTHTYFTTNCPGRPNDTALIAKSAAVIQGYVLAPGCSPK